MSEIKVEQHGDNVGSGSPESKNANVESSPPGGTGMFPRLGFLLHCFSRFAH